MLGPVLSLWHDARTMALDDPAKAFLPSSDVLSEAAKHTDFSLLEIDENFIKVEDKKTIKVLNTDMISQIYVRKDKQ